MIASRKREHSRKPDEIYEVIEACSPADFLELFARVPRDGWTQWGDDVETYLARRKIHSGYAGGSVDQLSVNVA